MSEVRSRGLSGGPVAARRAPLPCARRCLLPHPYPASRVSATDPLTVISRIATTGDRSKLPKVGSRRWIGVSNGSVASFSIALSGASVWESGSQRKMTRTMMISVKTLGQGCNENAKEHEYVS